MTLAPFRTRPARSSGGCDVSGSMFGRPVRSTAIQPLLVRSRLDGVRCRWSGTRTPGSFKHVEPRTSTPLSNGVPGRRLRGLRAHPAPEDNHDGPGHQESTMHILLLRHAKSSWDTPGLRDHDRPLSRRGRRAAPAMGAHFAKSDLGVDRIVSSTAARAWSTARLFRESFDPRIPLGRRRELYHADSMDLLAIALEEARSDDDRIMLVGHNPGMHDLALFLCGEGQPEEVARLGDEISHRRIGRLPPAFGATAEYSSWSRSPPPVRPPQGPARGRGSGALGARPNLEDLSETTALESRARFDLPCSWAAQGLPSGSFQRTSPARSALQSCCS
jgi:phosphohistidine phosphatase